MVAKRVRELKDYITLRRSKLFSDAYYLMRNPDVRRADVDPLLHYMRYGWREGRNPNKAFDTRWYQMQYMGGVEANPLLHYLAQPGRSELKTRPDSGEVASQHHCPRLLSRKNHVWNIERETAFVQQLQAYEKDVSAVCVSIIMPSYNRAKTIGRAIESVIAQKHQNWELWVMDDGSEDDTRARVESYNDARIRYVALEHGGVLQARNEGLERSSGDYIAFLDSDNRWRADFLHNMLVYMESNDLPAAYCAAEVSGDGEDSIWYLGADFEFSSLLERNYIDLNCFMHRRHPGEPRFDTTIRRLVDWDYILGFAAKERLLFAPFIGVDYYNGAQGKRITTQEYAQKAEFEALILYVQNKAQADVCHQTAGHDASSAQKRAVVMHMYHPQHAEQLLRAVACVPKPCDLFITTSLPADDALIRQLQCQIPQAQFLRYPNLGRDVAPFLALLATLMKYDVVGKFHTKRDMPQSGAVWRNYSLDSLLAGEQQIQLLLNAFAEKDALVMAGPEALYLQGKRMAGQLAGFLQHQGLTGVASDIESDAWGFFAGTMFWCKPDALAALLPLAKKPLFFPGLQRDDGLPEHHLERLFGLLLLQQPDAKIALMAKDGSIQVTDAAHSGADKSIDTVLAELATQYGEKTATQKDKSASGAKHPVQVLSFYLPQFHPTEFNNTHWGEGFTEWTNVTHARPRFDGHIQPKYPGKFGYYDLRVPGMMAQQGELAAQYGVNGFCFYYYRFGQERVLDLPLAQYLRDKESALPFCYCWANESWTRAWDGKTSEVLMQQSYDEVTLDGLVEDVAEAASDARYIRVDGKPFFLIYQVAQVPNPAKWTARLREKFRNKTGEELFLGSVYSPEFKESMLDFLDAVVQFPPHRIPRSGKRKLMDAKAIQPYEPEREDYYEAYEDVMSAAIDGIDALDKMFAGVCPDWDNAPRRQKKAHTLIGSTPERFGDWVAAAAAKTRKRAEEGKIAAPILFVNAWNEWAEGAMLEPSEQHGTAYLEALKDALER